jgi:hypothetical protein
MGSVAGNRSEPYTIRDYDGTGKSWLVHGPALPELGALFQNRAQAREYQQSLNDAFGCGYTEAEHARALDALAVAVENVAASELGGGA